MRLSDGYGYVVILKYLYGFVVILKYLFNINKLPSYHVFAYFKKSWVATKGPKREQLKGYSTHLAKPYHPKKSAVGAHKTDEIIRLPFLTPLYLYQTS